MSNVQVFAMVNVGFVGDTENIRAIAKELSKNKSDITVEECEESIDISNLLPNNSDTKALLLISGSHGLDFLRDAIKKEKVKKQIDAYQLRVIWTGHQAPKDLLEVKDYLTIVSLLKESITTEIEKSLADKLVTLSMVPNTLRREDLTEALEKWNEVNPEEKIPALDPDSVDGDYRGYTGVFLGGDAPNENGEHKHYSPKEAFEHGKAFALKALETKTVLLATNGPRTGKFYPNSPDPKKPIRTRFDEQKKWKTFSQSEFEKLTTEPGETEIAHAAGAPIDEVSAAFLAGIKSAGLPEQQYRFIDFQFGKSAYRAIIAALSNYPNSSVAYYGGESISYAEIGCFIPETVAFHVGSMSKRHEDIQKRYNEELNLVGNGGISDGKIKIVREINQQLKKVTLAEGVNLDGRLVADSILKVLAVTTARPLPLNMPKC